MKAHSRKARRKSSRRRARTPPWLVLGAVVATRPSLHGAERRPEALPADRRILLEPQRLEASLGPVRIIEVRSDTTAVEVSGALARLESIKYSAPISETPQTIQNIPRTLLEEQGATAIPGRTIADALVEVPLGARLLLRLNVYNITDREYVRGISNNGGRGTPGTPRSFLLSTALRFQRAR